MLVPELRILQEDIQDGEPVEEQSYQGRFFS